MIVLAYFIYFGVPYCLNNMIGFNFTLTALQAGTVCLALNCGAYMAEIIRAGILSVDSGQMEAARSLGLPYSRAMIRVVLPQAIRTMIPSIINQFIITLKDTSILSVIGFPELYVFPDMGYCRSYVPDRNHDLIQSSQNRRKETEPWP